MSKLNFWQWLGVALLIVGVVWVIYNKSKGASSTRRTMAEPAGARSLVLVTPAPATLSR